MDIDGKAYQVEILDTAGQDEYTPLRANFMHTGDGFLLVYSVLDDQTFEELRSIREQILQAHPNKAVCCWPVDYKNITDLVFLQVPMKIIGNKVDLAQKKRAVSVVEGQALADEFKASFLEVSVIVLCYLCTFFS